MWVFTDLSHSYLTVILYSQPERSSDCARNLFVACLLSQLRIKYTRLPCAIMRLNLALLVTLPKFKLY